MVEALKASRGAPQGVGQGETGAGDGGEGPDGADSPIVDIDSLDWQLIASATKERGPEVGMYLMAQKLIEALDGGFRDRMTKATKPFEDLRGHAMASAQTSKLWQGAMDALDAQGNLLFPEMADPAAAPLVFDIWRQITEGLPPEVANSPRMARTAVLEYRALTAGGGPVAGGAGDGGGVDPQAVASGFVGAMRAGARSTGVLPAGPGGSPVVRARQKPPTEEEQIRNSLLSEGQERSALGFRR